MAEEDSLLISGPSCRGLTARETCHRGRAYWSREDSSTLPLVANIAAFKRGITLVISALNVISDQITIELQSAGLPSVLLRGALKLQMQAWKETFISVLLKPLLC